MRKLYIKHLDQATNNISLEDRNFLFIRCKHKFNKSDKTHDNSIKMNYPMTWDQIKEKLSEESLVSEYKPELENDFECLRSQITGIEERVDKYKGKTDEFDKFHPASTCVLDIREDEEVVLTFLDVSFLEEHEDDIVHILMDEFRDDDYFIRFHDPYFYAYIESMLNRLLWKIRSKEEYNYKKLRTKLKCLKDKQQ